MSVADILEQMAQNAGRARLTKGGLIGQAISDLSLAPGQIQNEHEREAIFNEERMRRRAADARSVAQDARQTAKDAQDEKKRQADETHQANIDAILTAYHGGTPNDPSTNSLEAGVAKAKQLGMPGFIGNLEALHATETKPLILKPGEAGFNPRTQQAIPGMSLPEKPPAPSLAGFASTASDETKTPAERAAAQAALTSLQQTPATIETARHNQELERIGALNAGKADAAQKETERHNRAQEKAADPFGGAAAGGASGAELLAKMPQAQRDQAQALVEGRRQLDPRLASKPFGQAIINAAYAIDPTFDQGNYNARYKARTDLTNPGGTGGKTIGALNTAIQHAGRLSDLIEKLDNYESPLANAIVNPLRTAAGHTEVTNYDTVAPQLAKEIERVWRGAGGTAGEIHDLIETIGHNKGKQQQREALSQFVDLAKGKLDSLEQQRDNVMGKTAGATIPILFDQNKPIMEKIAQRAGGKPGDGAITVTAPDGSVHPFATQAQADAFKKLAGIR